MTVRDTLAATTLARRDAETLLAHVLGRPRTWLLAHPEAELSAAYAETFRELTTRRAAHEPLQYLTGVQEFFGLPLRVTPHTLVPRPETELLVEAVLAWAATRSNTISILDIGTGTGAIALALASRLPGAQIAACDLSEEALAVARHNAAHLALPVEFVASDLLAAFDPARRWGILVSNPPYVPLADAPTLQPEVRDFEPHTALFAGDDGLAIYRRLVPQAHAALHPGGLLALEIGFGQRDAVRTLLAGWNHVRFMDDYAAIPRVALAERA